MIGFININKQAGVSSAFITNKLKHIAKEKVGHLGTLDPMATGVLVVSIGKATRLFDYFLNKDKEYIFGVKFGKQTDTLDMAGKITMENGKVPTKAQILSILPQFIGRQDQIPPEYSAKNINGERAYNLARQGKEVNLAPKQIEIYSLDLLDFKDNEASLKVHCSSGTYVRSLARDIAKSLGTIGFASFIKRTKAGHFGINESVSLDEALKDISSHLISIESVFKDSNKIKLNKSQTESLICGKQTKIESEDKQDVLLMAFDSRVLGLADIIGGIIKIKSFLLE